MGWKRPHANSSRRYEAGETERQSCLVRFRALVVWKCRSPHPTAYMPNLLTRTTRHEFLGVLLLAEGKPAAAIRELVTAQEAASHAGSHHATHVSEWAATEGKDIAAAFGTATLSAGTLKGNALLRQRAATRDLVRFRADAVAAQRMASILCNQVSRDCVLGFSSCATRSASDLVVCPTHHSFALVMLFLTVTHVWCLPPFCTACVCRHDRVLSLPIAGGTRCTSSLQRTRAFQRGPSGTTLPHSSSKVESPARLWPFSPRRSRRRLTWHCCDTIWPLQWPWPKDPLWYSRSMPMLTSTSTPPCQLLLLLLLRLPLLLLLLLLRLLLLLMAVRAQLTRVRRRSRRSQDRGTARAGEMWARWGLHGRCRKSMSRSRCSRLLQSRIGMLLLSTES